MKKIIAFLSVIFVAGLFCGSTVFAEEMSYSVQAVLPENQKSDVSYFDLHMNPSEEQELKLKLINYADQPSTIAVTPRDAFTNNNGMVDYSVDNPVLDKTMKHSFTDLVSEKQVVTLNAKEEKEIIFHLKMPKDSFDGEILGGFFVQEVKDKETSENSNEANKEQKSVSGVQLSNRFSYTIGVKLSETDNAIKPEVKLGDVQAGLVNGRTAFLATLRNVQSTTLKKATVEANVYQKDKLIYTTKKEKLAMAPHSVFDYNISLENEEIRAGEYTLKLIVTSGEEKWAFTKEFDVEKKEAEKFNKEAVEVVKQPTNYWPWVVAGMGIILVGLLGYIVYQKKHN
ncbi:DUF916 and DUF3324 domain-containing protein [Candidatus Enterococcus ikei]|uniref:DUF916 and DUF3324 domain-containing protein n=1 Tax=Candidatus Enterococcus ikei TaxID=2815326 RepID=A0ABS3H1K9_9ENTE|nr:DUF916 and DUF3324 domain-containing protein [Enterococcus sp. DIV0869a]MBO0441421.1 DUF916 and DUF3324 domain-containing protein [Enterococcus sp. DIV0869a]